MLAVADDAVPFVAELFAAVVVGVINALGLTVFDDVVIAVCEAVVVGMSVEPGVAVVVCVMVVVGVSIEAGVETVVGVAVAVFVVVTIRVLVVVESSADVVRSVLVRGSTARVVAFGLGALLGCEGMIDVDDGSLLRHSSKTI